MILFIVVTRCNTEQLVLFAAITFLSLLYMMPFSYNGNKAKGLRNNFIFKNILLSLIWATSTVWFPLAGNENLGIGPELTFMFLRRFFFIYALATIYDIRDLKDDSKIGMQTIAIKLGVSGTKLLATASLLLFCTFIYVDPLFQTLKWNHFHTPCIFLLPSRYW
ncbi:MAG: UbiA family prenyltransferase [Bacteroidetes bacterium]|nr:UbiA family prenyltransferase [Bacteroidota bacterium]